MPVRGLGSLRFFQFESLETSELDHAVFSRLGGVSPVPWDSLNMGGTVGDERDNVLENHRRAFDAFCRPLDSMFDVWQVHSDDVVVTSSPRHGAAHAKADAILTDDPGVTLFMRFADCVPILLYDPVHRAVGVAHAGWRGTVRKVAQKAVARMEAAFGSRPEQMLAGIGPSIGPDHYPVGPEVVEQFRASFGPQAARHLDANDHAAHLNLWSANEELLRAAGVRSIELAGICTACEHEHWYSHRAESGATGRFGALLGLRG